jgi:hypothetical protein
LCCDDTGVNAATNVSAYDHEYGIISTGPDGMASVRQRTDACQRRRIDSSAPSIAGWAAPDVRPVVTCRLCTYGARVRQHGRATCGGLANVYFGAYLKTTRTSTESVPAHRASRRSRAAHSQT